MANPSELDDRFQQSLERRQRQQSAFKVLVVDDDTSILELLKTALVTLDDCEVATASSAANALKLISSAKKPFDCLLLDIQMPIMNGIELLREIRSIADYTETPVIMLTAMCERKYVDRAFLEGAMDYVTKPFDFMDLLSRLQTARILVNEREKSVVSQVSISQINDKHHYAFEEPIDLGDVARLLGWLEFGNYVAQLSRGRLFNSQTVGVSLLNAEAIYEASSAGQFAEIITHLAQSITDCLAKQDCIFSYRGGGVFLIVEHSRNPIDRFLNEDLLNRLLHADVKHGHLVKVSALVGAPLSMRSLSKQRAFAALEMAVESVEVRQSAISSLSESNYLHAATVEREQRNLVRKSVYEKMLTDLVREETYLGRR